MDYDLTKEEHDAIKKLTKAMRYDNKFWQVISEQIGGPEANVLQFVFSDEPTDDPIYKDWSIEWQGEGYYICVVGFPTWKTRWSKVNDMKQMLEYGRLGKDVQYVSEGQLQYV